MHLTDIELLALIFSATVHDVEHNGRTNTFHINTQSSWAVRYKNQSVLENHHIVTAFG